jgi:hypothetical protein
LRKSILRAALYEGAKRRGQSSYPLLGPLAASGRDHAIEMQHVPANKLSERKALR